MASEQISSGPTLNEMTPATITAQVIAPIAKVIPQVQDDSTSSPSSTTVDQDAPSASKSHTTEIQSSNIPQEDEEDNLYIKVAHMGNDPLIGASIPEVTSAQSSSTVSPYQIVQPDHPIPQHTSKWMKDHPLNNIIGQLSRPVSIRLQLHEQALFSYYDAFLTSMEPKTYKEALTQSWWIEAMQEELNEFERLEVWELVPRLDKVMVITLKWVYKRKLDELGGILKNKARLVAHGLQISQMPRGIFINQSKYALESLKKYGFESCDPVDTPMVEKSKLDEDKEGNAVDPSHYRVFADADHAGCQDTHRNTSSSVQFLGERLISWLSKRQKSAAISNSNPLFILKESIPPKRKLDLTTRMNFLRTMDTTVNQQVAMDEALVPTAQRLRIGRSNFRLLSDINGCAGNLYAGILGYSNCPSSRYPIKMDNKKHIPDLESFRNILHICPRVHGQPFAKPPFEEENLAFIHFLRHSEAIRTLTDVNINKLYQPWRLFAALINKCLTGKSSGYDSLRLSQAQILNSKAYKKYYAIATGEAAPKPKASVRRTRSHFDTSITPPTAAASPRLKASAKGKQTAKASKAKSLSPLSEVTMTEAQQLKLVTKRSMWQIHISQPSGLGTDEGSGFKPGVPDVPTDESEEELSWNSTDDEGDDNEEQDDDGDEENEGDDGEEGNGDDNDDEDEDGEEGDDDDADQEVVRDDDKDDDEKGGDDEHKSDEETREEESFDPIPQTPKDSEDEGDGEEDLGLNIGMESIFETTSRYDVQTLTSMAPLPITTPTMTSSTIATTTTTCQALILPKTVPSDIIQHLPSFGSLFRFDDRLRIVQHYMDQRMNEAVKVAIQIQSDWLCEEAQRENDEFLRTINENIKKIIKEQVKEQVKAQVSKILPRIEHVVNEQIKAKVLTRSSHSSRTSYAVAADLSEMELKKILIEKMEGNKRDDDEDKDEEPSARPDRGSKRRREGKDPESASAPSKTATKSAGRSTTGSRSR
nr:hypothetical protein [Tanacetum cinerariifolium]